MAQVIAYEVFPNKRNIYKMRDSLVNTHGFKEKENQKGTYFYLEVPSSDSWQIQTVLKAHKYKYRSYDKRYARSTTYRKDFFAYHKAPYHCAYCGKRVQPNEIEVDHLIPVSKAKTNFAVRTLLQIFGITNVNDPKNLVAACRRCNRQKSDKMGFWMIRGAIGQFRATWIIRNIIVTIAIAGIIYILLANYPIVEYVKSCLSYFA